MLDFSENSNCRLTKNIRSNSKTHTSEIAYLRKEKRNVEQQLSRMQMNNNKADAKIQNYMLEIKQIRGVLLNSKKENSAKTVLIDRLREKNRQIEAQAVANREYAKRIEQRLIMGAKGQLLSNKNVELREKIQELEKAVQELCSERDAKDACVESLSVEKSVLQRALEIRAKDFGLDGNMQNGLLLEIARLKEQNNNMALQLVKHSDQNKDLEMWLEEKNEQHTKLKDQVASYDFNLSQLEEQLQLVKKNLHHAESQRLVAEQLNVELQKQTENVNAKLKDADTKNSKRQVDFQNKVKEMQAVMAENKRRVTISESENARAQQELEKNHKVLSVTQAALGNERKTNKSLTTKLSESEACLSKVNQEARIAQSNLEKLASSQEDRQSNLNAATSQLNDLQQKMKNEQGLLAEKQEIIEKQNLVQSSLRLELESVLADLELLSAQRNEAATAMNDAVTISATSLEEQRILESKLNDKEKQLEELKKSKSVLQKAMLDQLTKVRNQLQVEKAERKKLDSALKSGQVTQIKSNIEESTEQCDSVDSSAMVNTDANDGSTANASPIDEVDQSASSASEDQPDLQSLAS